MIQKDANSLKNSIESGRLNIKKSWTSLARIDYSFNCEFTNRGNWQTAKHTDYICDVLDRVEKGELKRVMFFLPPRHSKSMTITETFPQYFIGKNPNRRVIEVSYSATLAQKFGRANRNKIDDYGMELYGVKVPRDNSSMTNWGIEGYRGGMISAGFGGAITGEGADLLLIDDPIKNAQEAESINYRDTIWNEYKYTLLTRLTPTGSIILIMTRWHDDDLAGRILREAQDEGTLDDWTVVNLPALAEEDDILGREKGEALWPEFGWDEAWAAKKKKEVGTRVWEALYQQNPAPDSGLIFQRAWLAGQFYKTLPVLDQMIQSWDCTFKDLATSDYVCGQVWGRRQANMYLIHQIWDRMGIVATMDAIRMMTAKYPQATRKLIEAKANGSAVIEMLNSKIGGLVPIEPAGGKIVRAQAASPYYEAGNIWLPDPSIATFDVEAYINEFVRFPNAQHDDRVDSSTQAINYFAHSVRGEIFVGSI